MFYAFGQIFIVGNCQKMKHNQAIWSHWPFFTIKWFFCLPIIGQDGLDVVELSGDFLVCNGPTDRRLRGAGHEAVHGHRVTEHHLHVRGG